jgi:hypothetical protein
MPLTFGKLLYRFGAPVALRIAALIIVSIAVV